MAEVPAAWAAEMQAHALANVCETPVLANAGEFFRDAGPAGLRYGLTVNL